MGLISLTQMFLDEIQITSENRKIVGCICFAVVLSNALVAKTLFFNIITLLLISITT
jgi:hypothetical protein